MRIWIVAGSVLAMVCAAQSPVFAQARKTDLGKIEFDSKCAHCHGSAGKGDGPTNAFMTRRASDLSVLAKANGGVLPVVALYDAITGDKEVAGHGTREMPAWGAAYRMQGADCYIDAPYDPEAYVRARVLLLIEYINRLQSK